MNETINQEIKKCRELLNLKSPDKPLTNLQKRAIAYYLESILKTEKLR